MAIPVYCVIPWVRCASANVYSTDNYRWTWSCQFYLWWECEQGDCQAGRSGWTGSNFDLPWFFMQGAGKVLSGTVTSVFGGVTMLWDMYQVGQTRNFSEKKGVFWNLDFILVSCERGWRSWPKEVRKAPKKSGYILIFLNPIDWKGAQEIMISYVTCWNPLRLKVKP